jgi:hypothetical protein
MRRHRPLIAGAGLAIAGMIVAACGSAGTQATPLPTGNQPTAHSPVIKPTSASSDLGTPVAVSTKANSGDSPNDLVSEPKYVRTTNWQRCRVILSANDNGGTYHGYVYASVPGSILLYWVQIENINELGWIGEIAADTLQYTSLFLLPYYAEWVPSSSIFLGSGQRSWYYTITLSPDSDTTAVTMSIWAPSCS